MKRTAAYYLLLLCTIVWCMLIVLPPILVSLGGSSSTAAFLYAMFGRLCHQYDSHSFHLFEEKLAVCARCSSIYFGFVAGCFVLPFVAKRTEGKSRLAIIGASLPMIIDVLLSLSGLHESTYVTRTATGLIFGSTAGIILTPYLLAGVSELFHTLSPHTGKLYESETR